MPSPGKRVARMGAVAEEKARAKESGELGLGLGTERIWLARRLRSCVAMDRAELGNDFSIVLNKNQNFKTIL